jgi:hypothetical protein
MRRPLQCSSVLFCSSVRDCCSSCFSSVRDCCSSCFFSFRDCCSQPLARSVAGTCSMVRLARADGKTGLVVRSSRPETPPAPPVPPPAGPGRAPRAPSSRQARPSQTWSGLTRAQAFWRCTGTPNLCRIFAAARRLVPNKVIATWKSEESKHKEGIYLSTNPSGREIHYSLPFKLHDRENDFRQAYESFKTELEKF